MAEDILNEADEILEKKEYERESQYLHDPGYQKLTAEYHEAVKAKNWEHAHNLLVTINLLIHVIQRGE